MEGEGFIKLCAPLIFSSLMTFETSKDLELPTGHVALRLKGTWWGDYKKDAVRGTAMATALGLAWGF